jgi:hypothetical protein
VTESLPVSPQDAAQELLKRRAARRKLQQFTEYTTPRWSPGKIHKVICEQLDRVMRREIDRLMLLCPPQHGKSTCASKRLPAYTLGQLPHIDVISASATASLAEEFGREVRNCIASTEYRNLFPDTSLAEDSQAKGRWNTSHGGGYYAVGIGGALMGRGGDLGIIDDPFATWEDAQSETTRNKVWDWYTGTFYNRMRPGSPIIVIQHRMHEQDLVGRLLQQQSAGGDTWEVVELPALLDDPPWPERYDRPALERIKANTPTRKWSALYLQKPTPDDGTFFQREWFKFYKDAPKHCNKYLSSDFGVTEDGDATEIGIHGVDHKGDLYLCLDGWGGQKSADVWIDEYLTLVARHKTMCEFNEAGVIRRAIEPFLIRRRRERNVHGRCEWLAPINDKAARARALQGMASMGRVWLPDNDYGQRVLTDLLKFPASPNDHTVDMCSLIALALDQAHPGILPPQGETPKRDRWALAYADDDDTNWKVA